MVGASQVSAGVTISSIFVSSTTPAPGSVLGVTIVYCEAANTTPFWLVALNPNSTTLQPCSPPAANQVFMVDSVTSPTGVSPVNGTQSDATATGNGWPGIAVPNTPPPCPYTQVFDVTIPMGTAPGPINLIVAAGDNYVQCNGGIVQQTYTTLTIPLPAPSCVSSVMTEGVTAAPNGLYLFDVDYSFVNAGSSNIVYSLPPNVSFVAAGPAATYNGGSNSVSWNLGNISLPVTSVAWALVSVNSGTASGTSIPNSATLNSANCGTSSSAVSNVTVQIPQIVPLKSENVSSLNPGQTVTYTLDWTASGDNLQIYDSYDNIVPGTQTTGSSVPWGYDGTPYQVFPGPGPGTSLGTWTVGTTLTGENFIEATVPYNSSGSGGNYPDLIRNVPGAEICDPIIVEGDLQIPLTAAGVNTGADAHMVVACNTSQGITLKAAISIDASPAHLFIQKNNIYPLPAGAGTNSLPFTITAGVWYTMRAQVQSSGSGAVTYNVQLWPTGDPTDVGTLSYTDTTAIQPVCSGGWRTGWQADETAGTDWYSNLKVFGPGPIVSAAVTDVVPAGITYVGSDSGGVNNGGTLSWNSPGSFPATIYSFDNPINWWGTAACPAPIYNSFTMAANSIPATNSNTVTLTMTGCVPTPTPTVTPTPCGGGTGSDFTWNTVASMPTARDRFGMGVVNNIIYAVGGENSGSNNALSVVEAYDPSTNTWSTEASLPTARQSLGVAVVNGILYAIGGRTSAGVVLNTVEAYNPTTNTWTTMASMPTAREDLSVGVVNGIIYAAGGDNGTVSYNTVEAYNPTTNTWSTVASMPTARNSLTAGVVNGILYEIGGKTGAFSNYTGMLATVEAYNPVTNTWSTVASLPTATCLSTCVSVNNILYVGGGSIPSFVNSMLAYDPTTNTWSNKTPFPTPRTAFGAGFVNGVLYEIGGYNNSFLSVNEAGTMSCLPLPTPTSTPTQTPSSTPSPTATPTLCSIGSWTTNGSALIASNSVSFPGTDVAGSAWNNTPINLGLDFDMTFPVYLGPNSNAADGIAFVLQSEGLNAIGGWGGGMGFGNYGGVSPTTPVSPSVDVPIDTWDDPGPPEDDPPYDHISVMENGVLGNWIAGPVAALPSQANVDDGAIHTFRLVWNASTTTLTVYFDGNLRLTLTQNFVNQVFSGNSSVYWGFTGSANMGESVGLPCQGTVVPTPTLTNTPTMTPTTTPTPQPTATFTPTPVGLHVWPNPFSTKYAVPVGPQGMPALQAYQVPLGAKMTVYTLSGELVNTLAAQPTGYIYWYGTNSSGAFVSPGIYYYVIQNGSNTLLTGKVLVLKD